MANSLKITLILAGMLIMTSSVQAESSADTTSTESRVIPARVLMGNGNDLQELLAPPDKPEDYPAWRAGMLAYRDEQRTSLTKVRETLKDPYSLPQLQWVQTNYVHVQMMAHERYFYDPVQRKYTVDRYLDDLEERYGGIDSVLVWPTYPNIGIDNRNQYDLWRDMPGGLEGVRGMVEDFHKRNVKVFVPIMYWDNGTRDEGKSMPVKLAELAKEINADGLNGDTMKGVTREFYDESVKLEHPLVMEPEIGMDANTELLAWNPMSWGYFWPYMAAPGVNKFRFLEPRHMTHVTDRWAHTRNDMLQYAFFNGSGYNAWENVWGIWMMVTPRDGEVLRRIRMIYQAVGKLLQSDDYEPHFPVVQPGVYATRFPGDEGTFYTMVNRMPTAVEGPQIRLPRVEGVRYYDLWNGTELKPHDSDDGKANVLSFEMEPNGYAAIYEVSGEPPQAIQKLLATMSERGQKKISEYSSEWSTLQQQIVDIPRTKRVADTPEGMVRIPAGRYIFESEGIMIEKHDGNDVQYPWEEKPMLKHWREMEMASYFIDKYPVTCEQFKKFMDETKYRPEDDHNFLKNWTDGNFPEGYAKKPVTWVSLEDARAYAEWADKRLPHEWEWQYAAQGTDGRIYPWGKEKEASRMPKFEEGRDQGPPSDVDAHPEGASPFGVMGLVGNVWQWTDEYQDDHTRAGIIKGGSYYRPTGSHWYFPQAHELRTHGKYLLMAPSLDRSATIGFRCVVDAQ